MNTYRVIFEFTNGEKMSTIINSSNVNELNEKIAQEISIPLNTFPVERKYNRFFTVIKENVCFIYYELLLSNSSEIEFDDIEEMELKNVQLILSKIHDNDVIAKALNNVSNKMIEVFKNSVSESRWDQIKESVYWQTRLLDNHIEDARDLIVEIILELINEKQLEL